MSGTELRVAVTYFEENILSIISTQLFKLSQVNNFQGNPLSSQFSKKPVESVEITYFSPFFLCVYENLLLNQLLGGFYGYFC